MLTLEEVYDDLRYGELSQLSISGQDQGVVNIHNWKPIARAVQMGLTGLYRRFYLKRGHIRLHLIKGVYVYRANIDSFRNSSNYDEVRNPFEHGKYDRYHEDIIQVDKITTASGAELPINWEDEPMKVNVLHGNIFTIPKEIVDKDFPMDHPYYTDTLDIYYKADHAPLFLPVEYQSAIFEDTDFSQKHIDMPDTYREALIYAVGARFHNTLSISAEFQSGNMYAQKYELLCSQLELLNQQIDLSKEKETFRKQGFA